MNFIFQYISYDQRRDKCSLLSFGVTLNSPFPFCPLILSVQVLVQCRNVCVMLVQCRNVYVMLVQCRNAYVVLVQCRNVYVMLVQCRNVYVMLVQCRDVYVMLVQCRNVYVMLVQCRNVYEYRLMFPKAIRIEEYKMGSSP
jgi:hypothetical protein